MRRALTAALLVGAVAAACASPGQPPGGPEDRIAPRVVAILPESNTVNARPNRVLVRYSDVIAEGSGTNDLARLVLVSPWDGAVDVGWRRTGLAIRPRKGWRPNTPYVVTILPGVADLRNNADKQGFSFRFSTGPVLPSTVVRGVVFDWMTAKPLPKALVQAIDPRDTTLAYVTASDSTGRFELRMVPPGSYLVRAVDEKGTANRTLDPREPWDSVRVTLQDSARAEFYVVVRDTIAPRIQAIERRDSVTVLLTFDRPLQPGQRIDTSLVRVVAPDSSRLPLAEVITGNEERRRQASADSVAALTDTTRRVRRTIDPTARRDTTPAVALPVARRDPLATELVLRAARPFAAGTSYRVTVTGLRGVLGATAPATRTLVVPRADTTARGREARDSAAVRPGGPVRVVPRDTTPTGRPLSAPADTVRRPAAPRDTVRRPTSPTLPR